MSGKQWIVVFTSVDDEVFTYEVGTNRGGLAAVEMAMFRHLREQGAIGEINRVTCDPAITVPQPRTTG